MLYFVDDLNLPEVDKYNTQSAIALLRQHIDYEHWYDPAKLAQKPIENCQYDRRCMNPTAGSFVINPRLQRHFDDVRDRAARRDVAADHLPDVPRRPPSSTFRPTSRARPANLIKAALACTRRSRRPSARRRRTSTTSSTSATSPTSSRACSSRRPSSFEDPEKVVHLWLHESRARLRRPPREPEDLGKFNGLMQAPGQEVLPASSTRGKFFARERRDPRCVLSATSWTDSARTRSTTRSPTSRLLARARGALSSYNETNAQMDLVLFEDAMKHVCRIARVDHNESATACSSASAARASSRSRGSRRHICGFTR